MHDTSTQSISKWKTIGAQRSQSSILSPSSRLTSNKYRPSKDRQLSSSKLFNKNRSRIESLDNIPKQDLQDSISRQGSKNKTLTRNQSTDGPLIRINSVSANNFNPIQKELKQGGVTNRSTRPNNFGKQKQLILLKEDYAKFKQKIITQLEIQKQNITKIVSQILQSVKQQLSAIEQKYARNAKTIKPFVESDIPSFKNFNLPTLNQNPSATKLHDLSTINHISPRQFSKNPTQKALIAELTSINNIQSDPITERFSKFYVAIQKIKSDLDGLHQISMIDHKNIESPMVSPLPSPLNNGSTNKTTFNNGFSSFLRA